MGWGSVVTSIPVHTKMKELDVSLPVLEDSWTISSQLNKISIPFLNRNPIHLNYLSTHISACQY